MITLAINSIAHILAHSWQAGVSQAATGSLLAAVWQGTLLAAAAGFGLRLFPKTPAAVRFAIWFSVFVIIAALPAILLRPHAAAVAQAGGPAAWITLDTRWSLAIAVLWATASLFRAATLIVAAFRVRALWQRATPVEGTAERTVDASPADTPKLDMRRQARLCTSNEVDRPIVIGFFSPKILIPKWLLEKLTPAELEQVLLHESGHLGRADDWMNLLQKIALVIFPLNPALAWVERRLCFERELAVDERVLLATGAPKAYAACLATLAEHRLHRRGLALVLGALGRESELGRRVGCILHRGERMKPLHSKFVLGGAMLGLLAAATGLEHCPQLVGFASVNQAQEASNRLETQTSRPVPANGSSPTFSYQPVVLRVAADHRQEWKTTGDASPAMANHIRNNELQLTKNLSHEVLLKASPLVPQQSIATTDLTQHPLDPASSQPPASLMRTIAFCSPDLPPAERQSDEAGNDVIVTQFVVLTSWRDQYGSRMVVSMAESSDDSADASTQLRPESSIQLGTSMQPVPSQQVHPYAAVPVRDGWLIFQL